MLIFRIVKNVNTWIDGVYSKNDTNFRYKEVNILMGPTRLETVKKKVFSHLESKIHLTVSLTLSRQERNFYDTIAIYVAALGEVKESWGKMGAKQKYFKHIEMSFIDILDL